MRGGAPQVAIRISVGVGSDRAEKDVFIGNGLLVLGPSWSAANVTGAGVRTTTCQGNDDMCEWTCSVVLVCQFSSQSGMRSMAMATHEGRSRRASCQNRDSLAGQS